MGFWTKILFPAAKFREDIEEIKSELKKIEAQVNELEAKRNTFTIDLKKHYCSLINKPCPVNAMACSELYLYHKDCVDKFGGVEKGEEE